MTPKFAFSTYRDAAQRLRIAARDQGIGLHPLHAELIFAILDARQKRLT